jgi:hypothetical protein
MDPQVYTETQTYQELFEGPVDTIMLPAASDATVAPGQVFEYNETNHNWQNYTGGTSNAPYVVCIEPITAISAQTYVRCAMEGTINIGKLDATSQSKPDLLAALVHQGIKPLGVSIGNTTS